MPSTYSDLKIQLMATGENNTTWGDITNLNLEAIEDAVVGSADVTFSSANVTLTLTDANTPQTARNVRLRCVGVTGGLSRNLVVPSIEKPYIIQNDCADSIVVKTAAGTGVTVPPGRTMWVVSDGTNVVDVVTHLSGLTLTTALPVTQGGTGATTAPAARTALGATTVGGNLFTLPNPSAVTFPRFNADNTVSALSAADFRTAIGVGTGTGTVTSVNVSGGTTGLTATGGPITTSGTITLGGTLAVTNGGTGTTSSTGSGSVVLNTAPAFASGIGVTGNVTVTNGQLSTSDGTTTARLVTSGGVGLVSTLTNHPLAFQTNNSERMRIDQSGNVGIGTATPGVRADIVGPALNPATQNTYALWVANSGGANGDLAMGSNASASFIQSFGARPLAINSQGNNVGIGTVSPATRLDVSGSATASENFFAATGGIWFNAANTFTRGMATAGTGVAVFTGGAERMRIDAAGNVGVGTNNPLSRFSVSGGDIRLSSNATGIVFTDASGSNPLLTMQSDNNLVFYATDASGGQRPIWSVLCRNSTAPLNFNTAITSANIPNSVGFKGAPASTITSGTLTLDDMGDVVPATGGITVPSGVFARGAMVSIYCDSASPITITQGAGLTLRLEGTATTGNRTLAARGMATLWFNGPNEAIIMGRAVT